MKSSPDTSAAPAPLAASREAASGCPRPLVAVAFVALLLPACEQQMANQPAYRPLEHSTFFDDGRASRPLEPGVVAREQLLDDNPVASGLTPDARRGKRAAAQPRPGQPADQAPPDPGAPDNPANYVSAIPVKLTEADLKRGGERFSIYCAPCHGPLGNGFGKIVERGFLRPPSFHTVKVAKDDPERDGDLPLGYSRGFGRFGVKLPLREAPVGYIFEVISRGYGGMPDYAGQVPAVDRWRIAAYVRALQLSRNATIGELPPAVQQATRQALERQP
jgi:mono/diheme cytochrome c family protein